MRQMTYAETYGEPTAIGSHRIAVRCGDCGQRVTQVHQVGDPTVEEDYIRCPDTFVPWGTCGKNPLTLERRDGPRYVEAIRRAGIMRRLGFSNRGDAPELGG